MPQTGTDWAFWAFSTILLGFILNIVAGLAAEPISKKLSRKQKSETKHPFFASGRAFKPFEHSSKGPPDKLSKEIDAFLAEISSSKGNDRDSRADFNKTESGETRDSVLLKLRQLTSGLAAQGNLAGARNKPKPSRPRTWKSWVVSTTFLGFWLVFTLLVADANPRSLALATTLLVAGILLVTSTTLLIKYMRMRIGNND